MKKVLISMIGVILLILICVSIFNGISVGKMRIYSVKNIEEQSLSLDKKIEEANTEINQNHAKSLADIEYLWGIIGGYAKDEGIQVILDVKETSIEDTYNINFTLYGSYVGIADFLYDIENDDELNYRIKNFKIEPSSKTTTTTTDNKVTTVSTERLQATFVVENIIINFN